MLGLGVYVFLKLVGARLTVRLWCTMSVEPTYNIADVMAQDVTRNDM